jgi:1-deoxy-D-xylulose-5-phosphate synthase
MRNIPNMIVSAPMDEIDLRNLMYTAQLEEIKQPFSIRYPRGCGIKPNWKKPFEKIEIGKGRKLSDGDDIAILTIGKSGVWAQRAVNSLTKKDISAAHYDLRFVKPLDEEMLVEIFRNYENIITVEDGVIQGGFGSAVLEFMAGKGFSAHIKLLGVPDKFIEQGTQEELYKLCGIDKNGIVNAVIEMLEVKVGHS